MHTFFKNEAQGCSTPLTVKPSLKYSVHGMYDMTIYNIIKVVYTHIDVTDA